VAGAHFEKINMHKHAAQCYCSSKNMKKASEMFASQQEFGQAAECYLKIGDYHKAGEFYAKAKLFANAFECFERREDWEGLLLCLSKNKEYFKDEERMSLVERYVPIALNQFYMMFQMGNLSVFSEQNKGQIQEMKIKMKYQKSVSAIQEEDGEEDGSSSDGEQPEDKTA
jgi:hypothetical protein